MAGERAGGRLLQWIGMNHGHPADRAVGFDHIDDAPGITALQPQVGNRVIRRLCLERGTQGEPGIGQHLRIAPAGLGQIGRILLAKRCQQDAFRDVLELDHTRLMA